MPDTPPPVPPEIVDRMVLALERQALQWAGHDFGPAYRDEIVRPALTAMYGDIVAGVDAEIRDLRSEYLDALSQLEGIDRLLAEADRLDGGTHSGWVTTSAVRLAGDLP